MLQTVADLTTSGLPNKDREKRCRLCGGRELSHAFVAKTYRFDRCADCGLVQIAELPDSATLQAIYDGAYFHRGKYVDDVAGQREQERRIRLLRFCGVPVGAKVLDFGCATGAFIAVAKNRFAIWGTDISPQAISAAKLAHAEIADRFFVTGATAPKLPEDGFDAVVLWDVVEHLGDPVDVVRRMAGYLKPGGVIAISTPNIGAPLARIMGKRWAFMTPPEHVVFFNRESLRRLVKTAGAVPIAWMTRGKWVNVHFLLYKLRRVFPELVSQALVDRLGRSRVGGLCLYAPTGDIQYLGARLPALDTESRN
jgi:2-polyprenyl-3-methyl-5-hydroxy-6-metoxy-1,4-benzoquinol methylase